MQDQKDPGKTHFFRWVNGLPINATHPDILVNVLEYWQLNDDGATKRFCWVTDIHLDERNVYPLMRAGRARWKIENETFNTLKNQGYHFEHNYGLGKQNLSQVFVKLMMLSFLADQLQQLCCALFQAALKKEGSKRSLWEAMRSAFRWVELQSMEMLYLALLYGKTSPLVTGADTS